MTGDERGFLWFFDEKMEENMVGLEAGGTDAVTDIGLWMEKKDAT